MSSNTGTVPLLSDTALAESNFLQIIVFAIISVILAQLWLLVLSNLLYNTLGLSKSSYYIHLVLFFLLFVFFTFFLNYSPTAIRGARIIPFNI